MTPPVITSDLCGFTIAYSQRSIAIPLPSDLRKAIVKDVEEAVKWRGAVFPAMFPMTSIVPQRWTLDAAAMFCSFVDDVQLLGVSTRGPMNVFRVHRRNVVQPTRRAPAKPSLHGLS